MFKEIKSEIAKKDEQCKSGKASYAMVLLGLFKEPMDALSRKTFNEHGFQVVDLPRNPYLK